MKKNQMMPQPFNPSQHIGGLPASPDFINNLIPVNTPPMRYEQDPISMIFGNYKRKKLAEATETEARIAQNSRDALLAKLEAMHAFVTMSSRIADSIDAYEHSRVTRKLDRERREIENYKLHAEAKTADYESKMSEIDYKIRLKQYNEMVGE